jgi:hypothetical protein
MFKEMWRSIVRWWQSLLGKSPSRAAVVAHDLPLLSDPDYEYLFMQLLEGVAHGWQQPRVIKFFHRVKQRAPKSQWIAWLHGFGYRLVNSSAPNEELARKMIQLSELDCGEVTTLAGEFGHQLLGRIYGDSNFAEEYLEFDAEELPELELAELVAPPVAMPLPQNTDVIEHAPPLPAPSSSLAVPEVIAAPEPSFDLEKTYTQVDDLDFPVFGEVPPELRIAKKSTFAASALPSAPIANREIPAEVAITPAPPPTEPATAGNIIEIEEFATMLQSDPTLVQEIATQLGIETTDPQVVLDAVVNQMQQQIQDGN